MNLRKILSANYKFFWTAALIIASVICIFIFPQRKTLPLAQSINITLTNISGKPQSLNVLTASTPSQRRRGLMFIKAFSGFEGMLFIYPKETMLEFWMYNTFIPLDIIFFNQNKIVVQMYENVPPHQSFPYESSGEPAKYVLELPAGGAERYQIAPGTQMNF